MADINSALISCERWQQIVSTVNTVNQTLPLDIRKRLNKICSSYLHRYGIEGVHERLNHRTVAQVFAEFDPTDEPQPMASGECDGVRFALYAPPPNNPEQGPDKHG